MSSQWSSGWADGAAGAKSGVIASGTAGMHGHDAMSPSVASTSASGAGSSGNSSARSANSSVPSTPISPASSGASSAGGAAQVAPLLPNQQHGASATHATRGYTAALHAHAHPSAQQQPHQQQHHAQQQDDEDDEDDDDDGAAGARGGAASDSKMKRGHGASCHQCKTTKDPQFLFFCTNKAEKGVRKRRCRKKYCDSCLKRSYGHDLGDIIPSWQCPSCLGLCICAACHRKSSKRGGAPPPQQAQPQSQQHHQQGGNEVAAAQDGDEVPAGDATMMSPAASPSARGRNKAVKTEAVTEKVSTPRSTKRSLAAASASKQRPSQARSSSRATAHSNHEQHDDSAAAAEEDDDDDEDEDECQDDEEEAANAGGFAPADPAHGHGHEHTQHAHPHMPAPLLGLGGGSAGAFTLSSPNPMSMLGGGSALLTPTGMGLGMGLGMGMGMGMGLGGGMTPNGSNYNLQLATYPNLSDTASNAVIDLDAPAASGAGAPAADAPAGLHQGLAFQNPRRAASFTVDTDDEAAAVAATTARFDDESQSEYGGPVSVSSAAMFQQQQSQAELVRQAALNERAPGQSITMSLPSKTRSISGGASAGRLSISPLTISRDQSGEGVMKQSPRFSSRTLAGKGNGSTAGLGAQHQGSSDSSSFALGLDSSSTDPATTHAAELEHLMVGMNMAQRQSFLTEAAALAQQSVAAANAATAAAAGSKTPLGQSPRSAKRKLAAVGGAQLVSGRDNGDISSPNQQLRLQQLARLKSQLGSVGGSSNAGSTINSATGTGHGSEASSGVPSPTMPGVASLSIGSAIGASDEEVVARTKMLQNQQQQMRLQHAIKMEQARVEEERRRAAAAQAAMTQQRLSPSQANRSELNINVLKVESAQAPTPSPPFPAVSSLSHGLPPSHTPSSAAGVGNSGTAGSRRGANLPSPLTHLTVSPNSGSSAGSTPASAASSAATAPLAGGPSAAQPHQLLHPALFSPMPHAGVMHLPASGLASPSTMLNLPGDSHGGSNGNAGLFSPPAPMFPTSASAHVMLPGGGGQQATLPPHMQWGVPPLPHSNHAAHQQSASAPPPNVGASSASSLAVPASAMASSNLMSPLPGGLMLNFPTTPAPALHSTAGASALPHHGGGGAGGHHNNGGLFSPAEPMGLGMGLGLLSPSPFGASVPHAYPVPSTSGISSAGATVLPAAPHSGSMAYRQLSASGQNMLMDGSGLGLGLRGESSGGMMLGMGLGLGMRGESSSMAFGSGGGSAFDPATTGGQQQKDLSDPFLRQTSANTQMQSFQ